LELEYIPYSMFHSSRKSLGAKVHVQRQDPSESKEQLQEPDSILERRMVNKGGKAVSEVLVKWKNIPVEESTWESYWSMVKRYPTFDFVVRSEEKVLMQSLIGE